VNRKIVELFGSQSLPWGDLWLTDRGVCRLHPPLARIVAGSGAVSDETFLAVVQGNVEGLTSDVIRLGAVLVGGNK
jgi:hypothetical protein